LISFHQLSNNPNTINLIFRTLAEANIKVDMISQTAYNDGIFDISITIPLSELDNARKALEKISGQNSEITFEVSDNITKLTVEGPGMEYQSGIAAKVFEVLTKQGIFIKAISTSETKISCIIDQLYEKSAIESILEEFKL